MVEVCGEVSAVGRDIEPDDVGGRLGPANERVGQLAEGLRVEQLDGSWISGRRDGGEDPGGAAEHGRHPVDVRRLLHGVEPATRGRTEE